MQSDDKPEQEGWTFHPEGSENYALPQDKTSNTEPQETITWTGSEFLHQQKSAGWYTLLFVAITGVAAFVYFISKDILSTAVIFVVGILFAIIAGRKPRQLKYAIDGSGLTIGQKHYSFNDFKSFSLQQEGAIGYIKLIPLGRLKPELSIYYAPEDEQRIFDALSRNVPHDQRKESFVDQFAKRIRF